MTFIYAKSFPFAILLLYDSAIWKNYYGTGWKLEKGDKLDYYPSMGVYMLSAFSGTEGNASYDRIKDLLSGYGNSIIDYRILLQNINANISRDFEALVYIPMSYSYVNGKPKFYLGKVLKVPCDIDIPQSSEQIIFPSTDKRGTEVLLDRIKELNGVYTKYINPWLKIAGCFKLPIVTPDLLIKFGGFMGVWGAGVAKKIEETDSFNQNLIAYPFRVIWQLSAFGTDGYPYYLFSNLTAPAVINKTDAGVYVAEDNPIFETYIWKGEFLKPFPV